MESGPDMKKIANDFKGLVTEICDEKKVGDSSWRAKLEMGLQMTDSLPQLDKREPDMEADLHALEGVAVELWNFSVAMKTKGSLVPETHAKMRHIAFRALELSGQQSDVDNLLKRQIMMGLKASSAWFECGFQDKAESILALTEKCIMRLRHLVYSQTSGSDVEESTAKKMKADVNQDFFTLYCQKLETSIALGKEDDALRHMMNAKELLPVLPKEGGYLSKMCYNIGLDKYYNKKLEGSIVWLRESYELGKGEHSVSSKTQARTLRLLANVYLETDLVMNLQNALNAVSLANKEHCHAAGLFLKVKILLLQNTEEEIVKLAMIDLIKLPELTVDLSVHVLQLICQTKRFQIAPWIIEQLLTRFDKSPEMGKLLITNLEVLKEAEMITEMKEFVEYCINAHHSGQPMEFSIKRRFHAILWEQAAIAIKSEEMQEAVDWYNYSLSLYSKSDPSDMNLAKLHRNRANCYTSLEQTDKHGFRERHSCETQLLQLTDHLARNLTEGKQTDLVLLDFSMAFDKARKAIGESLQVDPTSVHAHFIQYKLAMLVKDIELGSESLQKLCEIAGTASMRNDGEDKITVNGLIALAGQHALEHDQTKCAVLALEHLSKCSTDNEQVLTSLRCLIRLKLADIESSTCDKFRDMDSILSYIKTAYGILQKMQEGGQVEAEIIQTETSWFMKISWNVALQCKDMPLKMKDFFVICSQLLSLTSQDPGSLSKRLTCLLMSAAACLQVNRETDQEVDKKAILEECLTYLDSSRETISNLKQQNFGISDMRETEMELLLILYEFEAKIQLKDPTVESVLEKAISVSGPDPKTLETLAAISMEPPVYNKSLCIRALKVAIRKHLQMTRPDVDRCSKLFHSLIQLCLSVGSSSDLMGKEDAWSYYQEILSFITKCQTEQYPEKEIVWLMTKAWNCGINFFSCNKLGEAEKWCGMSMGMLKYLDTFKTSYENHMTGVYGDILSKLERGDTRQSLEI